MARTTRTARGYFEMTVTIGHDANGKRQRKRIRCKTLAGLRKKQEALLADKANERVSVGKKPLAGDYLNGWLSRVVKPTYSVSTYTRYEQDVRNHLVPRIGKNRLGSKFDVNKVQEMVAELLEADLEPRTIRNIVATLRVAMNRAIIERVIAVNPTDGVKLPEMLPPDLETVTLENAIALLVALRGHRLEALFWFYLTTGTREGEGLALMWDCVDFENNIITIRQSARRLKQDGGKSKIKFVQTKSKRVRYLPMVKPLRAALLRHKAHQDEERQTSDWVEMGLVFPNEEGKPIEAGNLMKRVFRPALARAELSPRIRIHDLRHATATILIWLGIDPKTVSMILGHSTVNFTLNNYVKAVPKLSSPALEHLGELLESDMRTLEIPARKAEIE